MGVIVITSLLLPLSHASTLLGEMLTTGNLCTIISTVTSGATQPKVLEKLYVTVCVPLPALLAVKWAVLSVCLSAFVHTPVPVSVLGVIAAVISSGVLLSTQNS